jgi:galactokinase/mevalonate kinase-like predicted kinase
MRPPVVSAKTWDYLIVTASNRSQAVAYESQLKIRRELGLLSDAREVLVVPDPDGRRVGSGGSTLYCLLEILNRQVGDSGASSKDISLQRTFDGLRALVIHAGGDSRRLPAYGPCGKIFVPMPGQSDQVPTLTLFDQQLPTYLALPKPRQNTGQIVVTSGDVLLKFDSAKVRFSEVGLTGLGCHAEPAQGTRHGVFCKGPEGQVRTFLQKPSLDEQKQAGAIDAYDRTVLDIGIMNLTGDLAAMLLAAFGAQRCEDGRFELSGDLADAVLQYGLDFYRELCCGMGSEASLEQYYQSVHRTGSSWDQERLERLFGLLRDVPFHVDVLPACEFLHFGTSEQLITSGRYVVQQQNGSAFADTCLSINNRVAPGGKLVGSNTWMESCEICAPVTLGGENVVTGLNIDEPLSLPPQACLDVVPGRTRGGQSTWFVRCYAVRDRFDQQASDDAVFCAMPLAKWLEAVNLECEDVWSSDIPVVNRNLWNAKLFPAVAMHEQFRDFLWMYNPLKATGAQIKAWQTADRYSCAEIATLVDLVAFFERRVGIRVPNLQGSLSRLFSRDSELSAAELAFAVKHSHEPASLLSSLLSEAGRWHRNGHGPDALVFPRIIHTLGSAISILDGEDGSEVGRLLAQAVDNLRSSDHGWLDSVGLGYRYSGQVQVWVEQAHSLAFESLSKTIIAGMGACLPSPNSALRSDEIVWGRAPARLDLGGGWTDTPPYSLEQGGCVVNAAVDLNGQPPIQSYLRVINELVIKIGSIDLGTRIEIDSFDGLLDYRQPSSEYALAKAALVLSGFAPDGNSQPGGINFREMLERFGGGIELTTLAAIPKGSGLGTSSIMGAVLLAVIHRATGRNLTQRRLFYEVLRLEQALTTGGGWQDQIGGVVGGVKIITTEPELVPDARIQFLVGDVLEPTQNLGQTLLYYTGITRLAKNILAQVVGRYLNRDHGAMSTLRRIHALGQQVAEAMSQKDIRRFGQLVATAWELNKELDPNSTNDEVEALLSRVHPYVFGAKLLGAGGGGFLLMVCKSVESARKVKAMLVTEPPNSRARFFDYSINPCGLVVTTC